MSGAEIAVVAILGLLSLYFIINNGIILIKQLKKVECPSVFPFAGGVFGAIAVLLTLKEQSGGMIFIPLLLDYGSIPIICKCLYFFISDWVDWVFKNKK